MGTVYYLFRKSTKTAFELGKGNEWNNFIEKFHVETDVKVSDDYKIWSFHEIQPLKFPNEAELFIFLSTYWPHFEKEYRSLIAKLLSDFAQDEIIYLIDDDQDELFYYLTGEGGFVIDDRMFIKEF